MKSLELVRAMTLADDLLKEVLAETTGKPVSSVAASREKMRDHLHRLSMLQSSASARDVLELVALRVHNDARIYKTIVAGLSSACAMLSSDVEDDRREALSSLADMVTMLERIA